VKTVVLGDPPKELEELIARRRALGQDRFDEVWEGDYHMVPGPHFSHAYLDDQLGAVLNPYAQAAGLIGSGQFNLGEDIHDFRVPDRGYHRRYVDADFLDTAAIVVEILSAHDETYEKFPFYAARRVDEIFVVDGSQRRVSMYRLAGRSEGGESYQKVGTSRLLNVDAATVEGAIAWP
jgi:hypothetical protein